MRDMLNNKQMVFLGTVTLTGTTPAASAWVDLRGFDACTLALKTNTVTDAGTAAGFTFTMQHGDDSTAAGAAAVAAASAIGGTTTVTVTADTDDDRLVGALGYLGSKRYVRVSGVGTTATAATVDVYAVLNKPHRAPTTFIGTSVAAT